MSKSWMKKKEQPNVEHKRKWADVGYLAISKNGNVLSIVIKNHRYVSNLEEVSEVLGGKMNYALIYEVVGERSGQRIST